MMRPTVLAVLCAFALGLLPGAAGAYQVHGGRPPSKAQVAHAKRMIRALDDYDAQLSRRMRKLEAERRTLDKMRR